MAREQFYVEVTDTFAGDANYCWVNRYLVSASTQRGAISKVARATGYRFRRAWSDCESARYDARGARVCAFVTPNDWAPREGCAEL